MYHTGRISMFDIRSSIHSLVSYSSPGLDGGAVFRFRVDPEVCPF